MTQLLPAVAVALGGYLIGSVSFARIVARLTGAGELPGTEKLAWGDKAGIDLESVSSGSLGRKRGPAIGCLTAWFDILKALVPVLVLRLARPDAAYDVICAAGVMAGHVYPVFHRFKGGRGTSTLIGALLVLDPLSIPATIFVGYVIGLYVFKDLLLAHHVWIALLPLWFAAWGRWDLVVYGLVVNAVRWSVSGPELRQWWGYRRTGELQSREFHETIERTHIGYIHGWLRSHGLLTYDYMKDS